MLQLSTDNLVICFAVLSTQAQKIEERRKSLEIELLREIESGDALELAASTGSATTPAEDHEAKNTGDEGTMVDKIEGGKKDSEEDKGRDTKNETGGGSGEGGNDCDALAALAEEQRRLEELERLEHEAETARLKQ